MSGFSGNGGAEATGVDTELDRNIGIVGAIALGVGTMIAVEICVLSRLAVSDVGAMAIVAFGSAAVVASFIAYAEFTAIYPESGGRRVTGRPGGDAPGCGPTGAATARSDGCGSPVA